MLFVGLMSFLFGYMESLLTNCESPQTEQASRGMRSVLFSLHILLRWMYMHEASPSLRLEHLKRPRLQ